MAAAPFTRLMMWVCAAVFAGQIALGSAASIERWAMYGPAVDDGEVWRLVTGGFLHVSLLHLGMNMFVLWVLGQPIETYYRLGGAWRFPALYMGALLAGSAGAYLQHYETPGVGASGAVYGLLAAAAVLPRRLGLGWNAFGVLPWIGLNLAFTLVVPGISLGAHVGGLIGGGLLAWLLVPPALLAADPADHD
jgi:membrane associated rhomboid family serine protease